MDNAGFLDRIGRENVCAHVDAALARAREILGLPAAAPNDALRAGQQSIGPGQREPYASKVRD